MQTAHLFAGVPVTDLAAAMLWYERLFGRAPDMRETDAEAVWRLSAQSSVHVAVDPLRAGHAFLTLSVPDLTAHTAALAARGAAFEERVSSSGVRRVVAVDPDGNVVTFVSDSWATAEPAQDFHLRVKQRQLDGDAVRTIRALEADVAEIADCLVAHGADQTDDMRGAATVLRDATLELSRVFPPDLASVPDHASWPALGERIQTVRVALRALKPYLDRAAVPPAHVESAQSHLDALEVTVRRRQNLGRGGRWVEG